MNMNMREMLFWLLFAVILLVWALTGGIHWGSALFLTLLCVVGLIGVSIYKNPFKAERPDVAKTLEISGFYGFGAWGWMLLIMALVSVFSILPMPLGLLSLFSPESASIYRDVGNLSTDSSSVWGTISAAPGRTAYSIIQILGFFCLYIVVVRVSSARQNMIRMVHLLVAAGCLWFGLYGLRYAGLDVNLGSTGAASAFHIGLPVNSNHISGVIAMLSLLSLGAGVSHRHRDSTQRRILWFVLYILFGILLILLRSRGAILGWGCGHVVLFCTFIMASKQARLRTVIAVCGAMFLIFGFVMYISASTVGAIANEYAQTEIVFDSNDVTQTAEASGPKMLTKTQMYGDFVKMAEDWGRSGTGRSAFADVYPKYQGFPYSKQFRHAENEYFEILLEYGFFAGILVLLLGFIGLINFYRTFTHTNKEHGCIYGLMAGVMAVLIQNCFDFNLRYWTVGVPFWIAVGILYGRSLRWKYGRISQQHYEPTRSMKVVFVVGISMVAVTLCTILLTSRLWLEGQTESQLSQLRRDAVELREDTEQFYALVMRNLSIRPHSAEVRKLSAFHQIRKRKPDLGIARKWYEAAQKLDPKDPDISIHLGKTCMGLGDQQCAADQFLLTASLHPGLSTVAMREMATLDDKFLSLPKDNPTRKALIYALIEQRRSDIVLRFINRIRTDSPSVAAELEYRLYHSMGFEEGEDLVVESIKTLPLTIELYQMICENNARHQRYKELLSFIETSESSLRQIPEYWRIRLRYSVYYGEFMGEDWYQNEIPRLFWQYRQISPRTQNWLFDEALFEARYAVGRKQYKRAERAASQALKMRPDHAEALRLLEAAKNAR